MNQKSLSFLIIASINVIFIITIIIMIYHYDNCTDWSLRNACLTSYQCIITVRTLLAEQLSPLLLLSMLLKHILHDFIYIHLIATNHTPYCYLIFADVLSNRKMLSKLLSRRGVDSDMVVNGREAVEKVLAMTTDHYDLIFMDNIMPVLVSL